jgi:hypothetical protein
MTAETNLSHLLSSINPILHPDIFVFATLSESARKALAIQPIMEFREDEGITVVVRQTEAEQGGLAYQYPCRMITLNVHSDLNAVGFLAKISTALAEAGISVNAVSAFYHDHLFVLAERAEEAMELLGAMSQN